MGLLSVLHSTDVAIQFPFYSLPGSSIIVPTMKCKIAPNGTTPNRKCGLSIVSYPHNLPSQVFAGAHARNKAIFPSHPCVVIWWDYNEEADLAWRPWWVSHSFMAGAIMSPKCGGRAVGTITFCGDSEGREVALTLLESNDNDKVVWQCSTATDPFILQLYKIATPRRRPFYPNFSLILVISLTLTASLLSRNAPNPHTHTSKAKT